MSALTSHLRKYAAAPVCHDIQINGQLVGLHDSGVLWWPDESILMVADLHLEKGSSYARRGVMLPPYDTGATLEKLAGRDRHLRSGLCHLPRRQFSRSRRLRPPARALPRHADHACSSAGNGSGSPAITIRSRPCGCAASLWMRSRSVR